jgi:hypothetical protein
MKTDESSVSVLRSLYQKRTDTNATKKLTHFVAREGNQDLSPRRRSPILRTCLWPSKGSFNRQILTEREESRILRNPNPRFHFACYLFRKQTEVNLRITSNTPNL